MAKRGYTGAVANMYGAVEHALTVVSIEDVTAHYRRITFDAPTMFNGDPMMPAEWIRLWAPDAVRPGREHMRGYTVVDPDPEQSRFSVEFVLHEPARSKAMGTDREKVIAAPSTTGKWLAFWRFIAGGGARTGA